MDISKTDLTQAARLLQEAAAYITVNAKSAREAAERVVRQIREIFKDSKPE